MNPFHEDSDLKEPDRFEPLLSSYLLEELSEKEKKEVEAHLAACESCREEMAILSSTAELLRRSTPAESAFRPLAREKILSAARAAADAESPQATTRESPQATTREPLPKPSAPHRRQFFYWAGGLAAAAVLVVGVRVSVFVAPQGGMPKPAGVQQALEEAREKTPEKTIAAMEQETLREVAREVPPMPLLAAREQAARDGEDALKKMEGLVALGPRNAESEARSKMTMESEALVAQKEVRATSSLESRAYYGAGSAASRPPGIGQSGMVLRKDRGEQDAYDYKSPNKRPEDPLQRVGEERKLVLAQAERDKLSLSYFSVSPQADGARPIQDETKLLAQQAAPAATGGGKEPALRRASPAAEAAPPAEPERASALQPQPVAARAAPFNRAAAPGESAPTPPPPAVDWKARVDEFLSRLDRKPGETPDMMFFRYWGDNPFVETSIDPLSTFGVDVDTASYTILRSYLYKQGVLPPREAVRTEELVNYFKSRYAPPTEEGKAFALHAELAPSPFAHEPGYSILKVGLKGREVSREKRQACSLVFVVDTSGSMRRENRLELVKDALKLLVKELDEGDTIGIVAFDSEARTILEPAPASQKERILDAISTLEPRHNTNVAAGLQMGYQMAASHLLRDGSNRVILLSDGVANTGITDPNAMLEQVRAERQRGVYLTCVGVGMGNLNDTLLEQLADRGNGQCVYVDRLEEARKVFVENLSGTLETIARDAKIQVEFDPARVIRYRLLGYENRAIADSAFRDNTVDAGEVGAGHEVTALYELKLKPEGEGKSPEGENKMATVRVRYLTVDHGEAVEIARPVTSKDVRGSFADASPRFQLSACVAEFAEVLRDSYWARRSTLDRVASMVEPLLPRLGEDQDAVELVALLKKADALVRQRDAAVDELARTVDAIKENRYLQSQIGYELERRRETNRSQLDDLLRQNNELRQRLEDILRRS